MSKYKLTILAVVIFVLPSALYIIVNFYWWLFDRNNLNAAKIYGAAMFILLGAFLVIPAYWKESDD